MAEAQDEIIIIEEGDAAGIAAPASHGAPSERSDASRKKKLIFIGSAVAALVLLGGGSTWFFLSHTAPAAAEAPIEEAPAEPIKPHEEEFIEPSRVEKMIEEANALYANGKMDEALKLYEKIALYSEAISQYNLGVVQLKEGEYDSALESFKRSIASSQNRCVSAINAAVCCLHLGQQENFNYYIDMALAYLPQETDSPLYSYYYALIHYYKGRYLEALSALKNPTTDEYIGTQNKMRAKIASMLGSYDDAITALENPLQEEDSFSLGLLYANRGDLAQAKRYLSSAILHNPKPVEEQLALAFVQLKSGQQAEAGELIKKTTDVYPDLVYTPYPVKVSLKPSLFDPGTLQKHYRNAEKRDAATTYQLLFYFAPYKVFNADQTISYIRKGAANIYIDDVESAKEYLQKSSRASNVDYGIAVAIQKALTFRLREANRQLRDLLKANPQHSILHYNLALTYAQLGDFANAYDHFLRSYHLDANNYLSGIFAMMSGELSAKSNPKLSAIVKDNLVHEPEKEEFELYRTLVDVSQNNYPSASKWLNNTYKERPLYLALETLIGSKLGRYDLAGKSAQKLAYLQRTDLLPHLMVIDTLYAEEKPKAFAAAAIAYLKKQPLRYDDLYFGPQITRDRAVLMAAMTGQLVPMIERLEKKLQTTGENTADIASALAQAYFYNRQFEQSYVLYNQLIDTYKLKDEHTLFLGAAASIGAEHYENAIPLLELSKLKNPNYLENRYALSLLYLQIENNAGASAQLMKMGNTGFVSRYFDFGIDTDKLAGEPKKYHPL